MTRIAQITEYWAQKCDAQHCTYDDGNGNEETNKDLQEHGEDVAHQTVPFYGLLLIIDYHVGQRLWCHVLAYHLQHLLGLLGLRNNYLNIYNFLLTT